MWNPIIKNSDTSVIRQIYEQISQKILSGELRPGEKIPSGRELSNLLMVSRNAVMEAIELLELEGYVVIKPQSGAFVAEGAIFKQIRPSKSEIKPNVEKIHNVIDLRSGIPDLDNIPLKKWNKIYSNVLLDYPRETFGYDDAHGRIELRKEICNYLLRMRGVQASPEQIVITNGSLHSLSILLNIISEPDKQYIIEDPMHSEFKKVLNYFNNNYYTVPVDYSGIKTDLLPDNIDPSFVLVTPSHQYPLGGCLPIQRKIELIEYAIRKNCYIIEDDYDSEYRYMGAPTNALISLDCTRVIYIGSFSKVLFPSVRIGFIVLPESLIDKVIKYVRYSSYFINTINQLTMSQFLNHRILEQHISKSKKLYKAKRNLLINELKNKFNNNVTVHGTETGLHLIAEFKDKIFNDKQIDIYKRKGLIIYPTWKHSEDKNYPKNQLIIGYSHLNNDKIKEAVRLL